LLLPLSKSYLPVYVFPVIYQCMCSYYLTHYLRFSINLYLLQIYCPFKVINRDCSAVVFLEHVTVTITFTYSRYRGDTEFYLVSPSGTESHLLHYRSNGDQTGDTLTWTFMSVHFWWENPLGTWTLLFGSRFGLSKGKDTCIGLNIRFSTHIYFL
jgi:hypothetical protein